MHFTYGKQVDHVREMGVLVRHLPRARRFTKVSQSPVLALKNGSEQISIFSACPPIYPLRRNVNSNQLRKSEYFLENGKSEIDIRA